MVKGNTALRSHHLEDLQKLDYGLTGKTALCGEGKRNESLFKKTSIKQPTKLVSSKRAVKTHAT